MDNYTDLLKSLINETHKANGLIQEDFLLQKEQLNVLDAFSIQHGMAISIFDGLNFKYKYLTKGFYRFFGIAEGSEVDYKVLYPEILANRDCTEEYSEIHEEVLSFLSPQERTHFKSFVCGLHAINYTGKSLRLLIQSIPLFNEANSPSGMYFNTIRNIQNLYDGEGYFMRIASMDKVYTFFSTQKTIQNRDVITPSELAMIKLWSEGLSLAEISAEKHLSINTVKNHFKAARNRLGARNNTALTELCRFIGIIQ